LSFLETFFDALEKQSFRTIKRKKYSINKSYLNHFPVDFAQISSASACERNWSTFGFIHSRLRNRLIASRANDLVFVHSNLKLTEKRKDADYVQKSLCFMFQDSIGDDEAEVHAAPASFHESLDD
jgi:hypothetical protein